MTASAVIVYNPRSGRGDRRDRSVSQMVELLRHRGLRVDARATGAPGDAARLSREAVDAGVEMIVAHGGDGTVNEAMQPLVGGPTPLAVWPGGTANVLARELGLPRNLVRRGRHRLPRRRHKRTCGFWLDFRGRFGLDAGLDGGALTSSRSPITSTRCLGASRFSLRRVVPALQVIVALGMEASALPEIAAIERLDA